MQNKSQKDWVCVFPKTMGGRFSLTMKNTTKYMISTARGKGTNSLNDMNNRGNRPGFGKQRKEKGK